MASVASDGPFSFFPGVDRQLLILEGGGLELTFQDGRQLVLERLGLPLSFAGEEPIASRLLDGPVLDFNVMTRRGQWAAQVDVLGGSATAGQSPAGVCMVLSGEWKLADGQTLQTGQGFWWTEAQSLQLTPTGKDDRLMLVGIQQAL